MCDDMYLVSVIIPTYNEESNLMNAVNSVINQTLGFENIELIIVDNSFTDSTKSIIKSLSLKYDNVIAVFSEKILVLFLPLEIKVLKYLLPIMLCF